MESKENATKEQQTKYNYCKLNKCHKTKTKTKPCPTKSYALNAQEQNLGTAQQQKTTAETKIKNRTYR
jgi:hypothetical protein